MPSLDDKKSRITEAAEAEGSLCNPSASSDNEEGRAVHVDNTAGGATDAGRRGGKQSSRRDRVHQDAKASSAPDGPIEEEVSSPAAAAGVASLPKTAAASTNSSTTPVGAASRASALDDRIREKVSNAASIALTHAGRVTAADQSRIEKKLTNEKVTQKRSGHAARLDDEGYVFDSQCSEAKEEAGATKLPSTIATATATSNAHLQHNDQKTENEKSERRARDADYGEAKATAKSSGPELFPASQEPFPPGMQGLPPKGDNSRQGMGNSDDVAIIGVEESPDDQVEAPDQEHAVAGNVRPGAFAVSGISRMHGDVENSPTTPSVTSVRTALPDYDAQIEATIVHEPETVEATPLTSGGRVAGCAMAVVIVSMLLNIGAQGLIILAVFALYFELLKYTVVSLLGVATILSCTIPCANKDDTVRGKRMKGSYIFHIAAFVFSILGVALEPDPLSIDTGEICLYNTCIGLRSGRSGKEKFGLACYYFAWPSMAAAVSSCSLLLCRIDGQRQVFKGVHDKVFFGSIIALNFLPVVLIHMYGTVILFRYGRATTTAAT